MIKAQERVSDENVDIIDETDSTATYASFRKKRTKSSWSEKRMYSMCMQYNDDTVK